MYKNYRTVIYDTEDLVMAMYDLLEHSFNYSERTGCLWLFFSENEANIFLEYCLPLIKCKAESKLQ